MIRTPQWTLTSYQGTEEKALSTLFFLTAKRDGRIKGRQVADGSKQLTSEGYKKSNGASSTCSTNGVIITTTIDRYKGCDVTRMDIPGEYLHTINNEFIIMRLR